MRRKIIDTQSWAADIDVSLAVSGETIEKTQHEKNCVPPELRSFVVEGAALASATYASGTVLVQRAMVSDHVFWLQALLIDKVCTVRFDANDVVFALHYILKGTATADGSAREDKVLIRKSFYQLIALGGDANYSLRVYPGLSVMLMISVSEEVIERLTQAYGEGTLRQIRGEPFKNKLLFQPLPMSARVQRHISSIIDPPGSSTPQDRFARDAHWEQHLAGLFGCYLDDLNKRSSMTALNQSNTPLLERLEAFVEQQLPYHSSYTNSPLHLRHILSRLKLNARDFEQAMQQRYGCTWRQFVHDIRMRSAQRLLRSKPGLTIGDIASELGYSFPTHFTRAFKLHTGYSPIDYRRRQNLDGEIDGQ